MGLRLSRISYSAIKETKCDSSCSEESTGYSPNALCSEQEDNESVSLSYVYPAPTHCPE